MENIKLRKITNRVGIMLDASVLMVLFNWFSVLCSFRFPLRMASDQLVANVVAVNLNGKFKGQEVRELGQAFLNHAVAANHAGLVIGQQVGDLYVD